MSEDKKKEQPGQGADPKVVAALHATMNFMLLNELNPVLIVAQLPDGSTIDMHNEFYCGACIAGLICKMDAAYKEKYPGHVHKKGVNHSLN